MFDLLDTIPWWVFCAVLTFGAAAYGICMRFVRPEIDGSLFSLAYTGISTALLGLCCLVYWMAGGSLTLTMPALATVVIMGPALVGVDLGIIRMYRAGAPVSLGMPFVRAALALVTSFLGIVYFHETLDMVKGLGILCASVGIFLLGQRRRVENKGAVENG